MGIQTNNNKDNVNTLNGASNTLYNLTRDLFGILSRFDVFADEIPYTARVTDLTGRRTDNTEANLCGEYVLAGKRGGANRIRVYMVKKDGLYIVSVRYGHNVPLRSELKEHGFGGHYIESPTDGRNEDKIRFTIQSFKSFVSLISKLASASVDDTVEAVTDESVTA